MAKKFQVIWAKIAEKDLANILEYITRENPDNAKKILQRIKARTAAFNFSPQRGRVIPELKNFGIIQYRELIIPPWGIFYRISENKVYVLSVLDSRQNLEDILLQRFLDK